MNYYNIYKVKTPGLIKTTVYKREACFSAVYNKLDDFESITVYICKDDFLTSRNYDHCCNFTKEDISKYIELLNKVLDINITLKSSKRKLLEDAISNCYAIKIPIINVITTKIALNAVRYLYEGKKNHYYYKIVKAFLGLNNCRKLKPVNLINKFMLAHYATFSYSNGHSITPYNPVKILTKKQWNKVLNSRDNPVNILLTEYVINNVYSEDKDALIKLFYEEKYVEAYLYLKKLQKNKVEKKINVVVIA